MCEHEDQFITPLHLFTLGKLQLAWSSAQQPKQMFYLYFESGTDQQSQLDSTYPDNILIFNLTQIIEVDRKKKKKKNQALLMSAMSDSQAKEIKWKFKKVSKLSSLQKTIQCLQSMMHLTVTNPAVSKLLCTDTN